MTARLAPRHRRPAEATGADGNQRLTAMTGVILLLGFAVEGFTVLQVHRLLWLHFALGLLLIGPVTLKICSTCYRFIRYYTGAAAYVRKGPPAPLLRVLGPLVILTSVAVLGTGVILALAGPGGGGPWLFLHKASFILWFGVMTIHVLNYAPRLPRMLSWRAVEQPRAPAATTFTVPGGAIRWLLLAVSLAAGFGIAAITMQMSTGWGLS